MISRKSFERLPNGSIQAWRENPPVPYSKLRGDDWLDTMDLCRLFGYQPRTIYRYLTQGLKTTKVGLECFFRKRDVEQWRKDTKARGAKTAAGRKG